MQDVISILAFTISEMGSCKSLSRRMACMKKKMCTCESVQCMQWVPMPAGCVTHLAWSPGLCSSLFICFTWIPDVIGGTVDRNSHMRFAALSVQLARSLVLSSDFCCSQPHIIATCVRLRAVFLFLVTHQKQGEAGIIETTTCAVLAF